ncbi:MAG TPA: carboxypeptidase regulatory-like domain-containing protein, partial [Bryobacteraceae bacterium]|nr:carboxypeptidase regulatory-like domain-containing protein [Bryobacteraceae bacterium]
MSQVRSWGLRVIAVMILLTSLMYAQSDTAAITGIVRDQTGAVVPNGTVVARNEATGLERRATTNQDGYYILTNLPPGLYTVSAEAAGFKKFESRNNQLTANVNATVDIVMSVGQLTETVEVVATAPPIQADTATVGRTVTTQQIENLPLNGRNPLFLAQLKAGVRRGSSMAGFSFGLDSGGFAINGSRGQDNLITFDGAPAVRTRANGTSIGAADVETIQEIQVLTANYNAEYGRAAGGQIRMVTKSGTRDFHGSLYEYFRNDKLDANTWARNRAGQPREARRFNQFGYVASGPIFIPNTFNRDRNKLFFLWGQEWVRYRQQVTAQAVVPSLAMRQGNFGELLNASNPFFGRAVTINDPVTGQPFPNNVIPQDRLSRNGIGFLRAYPEPTPGFLQGRNNYFETGSNRQDQRKDTISIDFLPAERHTLRYRRQYYQIETFDAFRENTPIAPSTLFRPNFTHTLNHIWTLSPTIINEALASLSVDRVRINVIDTGRYQRAQYGINYPYIFPERKEILDKVPTIAINEFGTVDGGPYPASSAGPIYVFSNTLTWIKGAHTLKFGGLFERAGQNDFDQINVTGVPGGTNNQNGRFEFTNTGGTGLAVANAALGIFSRYAEIGQRAYTPYRSNMFEWFAQDSWKATDRLRLELGLRWTYMTPYFYSLWGNMAVFDPNRYDPARAAVLDPATGNVISGDRFNGVVIPGNGWPDAAKGRVAAADTGEFNRLFSGSENRFYGERRFGNFAPRFGLAYQFTSRDVFRAGGGRFFSRPGVADNIFLGGNPPFQPMVSIATGSADNPGGGSNVNFPQFFMTQDPVFKIPSAWNWNVTYERQVGSDSTVSVAYVGRVGLHMERERDLNALRPGTRQANSTLGVDYLRPYKGFAFIPMNENASRSEYNGLQVEFNKRFSKGLTYGAAYTYSKSMDNANDRRTRLWNPFDDRNMWGPSNFDTRHVLVVNAVYELPFLRGGQSVASKVFGNWQITGVAQFQTGSPYAIGTNDDFAGIG